MSERKLIENPTNIAIIYITIIIFLYIFPDIISAAILTYFARSIPSLRKFIKNVKEKIHKLLKNSDQPDPFEEDIPRGFMSFFRSRKRKRPFDK